MADNTTTTFSRRINIYVDSGQALAAQAKLTASIESQNAAIDKNKVKYKEAYEKYLTAPTKQAAEEVKKLGNALDKQKETLGRTTEQLDRQNKKISGELSPSIKDLRSVIQTLNRELSVMSEQDPLRGLKKQQLAEAEAGLKSLQGNVKSVAGGWAEMLKSAGGVAFGVVVGNMASSLSEKVMSVLGAIGKLRTGFENSSKTLSAITGADGAALEYLQNAAVRLSTQSTKSAEDFLEAMKLIASAKPELLKDKEALALVTEEALRLSKATGMDLPEAASKLTDALNQYNAPASEAAKYVDILTAAAKYGAAEVPGVTEALLEFGPVAKQANVQFNESAAAIELLAERGVKGAEAGTKLRNVMLTLAASKSLPAAAQEQLAKYGVNLDILSDKTLSFEQRLTELSKIQNDTNAMQAVFDKQNVVAGQILLSNIPRYAQLAEQAKEVGVANAQASTNTATLSSMYGKLVNVLSAFALGLPLQGLKGFIGLLTDGFTWVGKLTGVIQSQSQAMEQERYSLNVLLTQITSTNEGSQRRKELIEQLNNQYPTFLGNLDKETASNTELRDRLTEVNKQLTYKIVLQRKGEEVQAAGEKHADKLIAQQKLQEDLAKQLVYYQEKYNLVLKETKTIEVANPNPNDLESPTIKKEVATDLFDKADQAGALLQKINRQQEGGVGILFSSAARGASALYNLTQGLKIAMSEENRALTKLNDIAKAKEDLENQFGINNTTGDTTTTDAAVTPPPIPEMDEEARKKFMAGFKKVLADIDKLKEESFAAGLSGDDKELNAVRLKYTALKEEARKYGVDLTAIEKLQATEVGRILKASDLADQNTKYATRLAMLDAFYADEKNKTRQAYADGKITKQQYENEIALLDVQHKNSKADVARELQDVSTDAAKQYVDLNKAANDADLEYYILTQEKKKAALLSINETVKTQEDKMAEQRKAGIKQVVDLYLQMAQQALSGIGTILTNIENADLAREKKINDKRIKDYDDMLGHKSISQRKHDKEVERLQKEFAQKELELKVKQFKREQAIKIVETTITTAAAAIQAYNSLAGIPIVGVGLGIAAALATAAMGAVQIGIIASAEPPSMGDGGEIEGPSHTDGGVDINAEGGEFVVKNGPSQKYRSWLKKINSEPRNFNARQAMENVRYKDGGVVRKPVGYTGVISAEVWEERTNGGRGKEAAGTAIINAEVWEESHERRHKEMIEQLKKKQSVVFSKDAYDKFNENLKLTFAKRV